MTRARKSSVREIQHALRQRTVTPQMQRQMVDLASSLREVVGQVDSTVSAAQRRAQLLLDAAADDSTPSLLARVIESLGPLDTLTVVHLVWAARGEGELEVRQGQRAKQAARVAIAREMRDRDMREKLRSAQQKAEDLARKNPVLKPHGIAKKLAPEFETSTRNFLRWLEPENKV